MKLMGYRRENGTFGIRNHIAVIPSVFCANHVAEEIAKQVKMCVALPHQVGCGQHGHDMDQTINTLIGLGRNPNVGAVLIVGLGCERFSVQEFYDGIATTGKAIETVVIQEAGGTLKAINEGVRKARLLAEKLSLQKKEEFDTKDLLIGTKCGGTDATSGIAANPALGCAIDKIIDDGGSAILTEIGELIGTEEILRRRAKTPEIGEKMVKILNHVEEVLKESTKEYERTSNRAALVTPGNFDGGVSSVTEKALGGVLKSGTRQFVGTLEYSEQPKEKGLFLMNAEGQDGEAVTPMCAAGAQIIVFTSGRGTPTGFPIVPVIKITGNNKTFRNMEDNIDINAGTIITGEKTLEEVGQEIYDEICAVANGKVTKAEFLGHKELFTIGRWEVY